MSLVNRGVSPGNGERPSTGASEGRISVADMDELVMAGEAVALLPEFGAGPTLYEQQWWAVPQGPGEVDRGYALVPDEQALELTATLAMLQGSAAAVHAAGEQRRLERDRAHGEDPGWPYAQPDASPPRW
jgi:hypothetical protein